MSAARPVAGDAAEGLRGGLRVESGQLPGGFRAEAIINRVVAGDSPQRFRGGARVVSGQLFGRGHGVAIGVVIHGSGGFCASGPVCGFR